MPLPSELSPTAKGHDADQRLRRALADAIRGAGRSRDDLAAALSVGGDPIGRAALDNWTAPSHPHALPAWRLAGLLRALGPGVALMLANELLAGSGLVALDEQWARYARVGQLVALHHAMGAQISAEMGSRAPGWGRP